MESIVRVFLVDGRSKAVRYDEETTVERVLQVVVSGIGIAAVAAPHFSLRLLTGLGPSTSISLTRLHAAEIIYHAAWTMQHDDSVWLHPCLPVARLRHVYSKHFLPSTSREELRFELRLRFIPQSAYELLLTEAKAFTYLHDQVFNDFLGHLAWKVNQEAAVELAALKVSRDHSERQAKTCIDQKLVLDSIDVDAAIQKYVPHSVLSSCTMKPSALKKHFISLTKKYSSLTPTDSVLRSLSILIDIVKFDVEVFKASMGVGWGSPVDLLVGPEVGISYRVNERCDISRMAELRSVLEITVKKMESSSEKTVVQLKMSGNAQPMLITVSTYEMAESLAHLIDGYQMMFNQRESVFKMKGLERCESVEMRAATLPKPDRMHSGVEADLRIKRELVTLKELIGGGQFGNVYKGILSDPTGPPVTVAIKVCKVENEPADTQLILQESHLMKNFRHEHIISLVGVCVDSPMWLVMELAPLGELRQYLQSNKSSLDTQTLILFCLQVIKAIQYLHELEFIHRDVAARNVLVSTPNCVKLTDFGLSRSLDYDAVYTASRGKLPIKWLAPESINYRHFSMASDVWMYGVCVWEILSWGVKPWQGIANADVISQIEAGSRPLCPEECPIALYTLLERAVWALEPAKRPTAVELEAIMQSIHDQMKRRVHIDDIRVERSKKPVPVILTNMSSVPNLTLYRTMEQQRRQAEEDEKWLEEQEDMSTYAPDVDTIGGLRGAVSNLSLRDHNMNRNGTSGMTATQQSSPCIPLERVRRATSSVVSAVSHLHNSFNRQMRHDDFVLAIRDITAKLREMFNESTEVLSYMEDWQRHEVEITEALMGNDMRQMSKAMQQLVEHLDHPSYNSFRREIVRIARELSTNCENFLAQLVGERRVGPGGTGKAGNFSAILSDC